MSVRKSGVLVQMQAQPTRYGSSNLKAVLERIATKKEVLMALANQEVLTVDPDFGTSKLAMWIRGCQRVNMTNFMIVALDDEVADACEAQGVAYWRTGPMKTALAEGTKKDISAQKFGFIKEFLLLGYSVLLSDVDIVVLQNPFQGKRLYRDSDVEVMTDGFDARTAYGWSDPFNDPDMGWSQYAQSFHIMTINSGLFYVRPNVRTVDLMHRIYLQLIRKPAWDQVVFNMLVFQPAHGKWNKGSRIAVRIMDMDDFMNSKRLFRTVRHDPSYVDHTPVMVHVNYHPDKLARMVAIWKRYVDGDTHALDGFTLGTKCWKNHNGRTQCKT